MNLTMNSIIDRFHVFGLPHSSLLLYNKQFVHNERVHAFVSFRCNKRHGQNDIYFLVNTNVCLKYAEDLPRLRVCIFHFHQWFQHNHESLCGFTFKGQQGCVGTVCLINTPDTGLCSVYPGAHMPCVNSTKSPVLQTKERLVKAQHPLTRAAVCSTHLSPLTFSSESCWWNERLLG